MQGSNVIMIQQTNSTRHAFRDATNKKSSGSSSGGGIKKSCGSSSSGGGMVAAAIRAINKKNKRNNSTKKSGKNKRSLKSNHHPNLFAPQIIALSPIISSSSDVIKPRIRQLLKSQTNLSSSQRNYYKHKKNKKRSNQKKKKIAPNPAVDSTSKGDDQNRKVTKVGSNPAVDNISKDQNCCHVITNNMIIVTPIKEKANNENDNHDALVSSSTPYVVDIYNNFRDRERITSVRPNYLDFQPHINNQMRSMLIDWLVEVHLNFKLLPETLYLTVMRSMLIDWLVEVHLNFKLLPETLYLTVNILDRYLARKEISRKKLQLVGITCLLIASKYEETIPPKLGEFAYVCHDACTRKDIVDFEETMLNALAYRVTIPSSYTFLLRYLKAATVESKVADAQKIKELSSFILDGTLTNYNLLQYLPSQLAAGAVYIARRTVLFDDDTLDKKKNTVLWTPTLFEYTAYTEKDIIPIARAILTEKVASSKLKNLQAVNRKYTSSQCGNVAKTVFQCDF
eukprot:CAMPEP_0194161070 /NCGR_PEP_ID=MMETSP0152-20130528/78738_1 /TAXON_ID=1049557 /ORGANISM="Thalassiothrix antarctica, Strain L6-D1" /LENGTH=509 /DNA_ID=CAMNT_0038870819 /DNA_START=46 /DNA_END=1575 /DNA_ORIENTATION=-